MAQVLTPEMVAERWGCSANHVRNLIKRGKLKATDLNEGRSARSLLRIQLADVEQYERSQDTANLPPSNDVLGTIYVVKVDQFVKIGIAEFFAERLPNLRAGTPHEVTVLATFPGTLATEKALHQKFAALRHHHEWFRLEGELVDWINAGCPL